MRQSRVKMRSKKLRVWLVALVVSTMLPATAMAGSADAGRKLFTGEKSFENGGPACMSCHNAGVGALGGGSLGPDLTKVMTDEDRMFSVDAGWINGGGSPVMGPIFEAHEVTEAEVENLQAFLTGQANRAVKASGAQFAGGGIVGLVVLLIIIGGLWSGRFRNRNKGTAHEAMWRNYGGKGGV